MRIDCNKVDTVWECVECSRIYNMDLEIWAFLGFPVCDVCEGDLYLKDAVIPDEYLNN